MSPFQKCLIAATAVVAVLGAVAWLFREEDALVKIREELQVLQQLFTQSGLPHVAKLVSYLVTGNLPGFAAEVKYLVRQLSNPTSAAALLNDAFATQLAAQLAGTSAQQTAVLAAVKNFAAANPAAVKAAGLAIATLTS